MRQILAAALAVILVLPLFGQETTGNASYGVIVYTEGRDVVIQRDGRRTTYSGDLGDAIGIPVFSGDVIETDNETALEIQMAGSRGLVKVAENTIFTLDAITDDGGSSLSVTYGRVRARVGRLVGAEQFEIRGATAVCGVRGTDFGFDLVIGSDTTTIRTQVYCFEGQVDIRPVSGGQVVSDTEPVSVEAGEMVWLETPLENVSAVYATTAGESDGALYVPEPVKGSIAPGISSFWNSNDFRASERSDQQLLSDFPGLSDAVVARLGDTSVASGATASAEAESPVAGSDEQTTVPSVSIQEVTPERAVAAAEESGEREDRGSGNWLGRTVTVSGIVLTSTGVLAEAAAISLYYFGDTLFSGWTDTWSGAMAPAAMASGGAFVVGIIGIMIGQSLGR